jgi:hypothetical protein
MSDRRWLVSVSTQSEECSQGRIRREGFEEETKGERRGGLGIAFINGSHFYDSLSAVLESRILSTIRYNLGRILCSEILSPFFAV